MRNRLNIRTPYFGRRGFTMLEMVIAMSISSLVMIAVAVVQCFSGRAIKEMYGQTRTRSSRLIAIDQIRYRLVNAKVGSCTYTNGDDTSGYTQIDYLDPNISTTVKCRLYFLSSTNT